MSTAVSISGATYYSGDTSSDAADIAAGGLLVITQLTPDSTQQQWFGKGRVFRILASNSLDLTIPRATTVLNIVVPPGNFPEYTSGRWACIAVRWNTAGANADQQIYYARLRGVFSEPSSYTTQQVGAGSVTSDAATQITLMNNAAGSRACSSPTLAVVYFNAYPSLKDFMYVRDEMLVRGRRANLPGSVIRAWRFDRGAGNVIDIKGQQPAIPTGGTPAVRQGPLRTMAGALASAAHPWDVVPEPSGVILPHSRARRLVAARFE